MIKKNYKIEILKKMLDIAEPLSYFVGIHDLRKALKSIPKSSYHDTINNLINEDLIYRVQITTAYKITQKGYSEIKKFRTK